jgi:glyoxylase-like metal-dependent hydrolase (beta-lactamase superfamily II)
MRFHTPPGSDPDPAAGGPEREEVPDEGGREGEVRDEAARGEWVEGGGRRSEELEGSGCAGEGDAGTWGGGDQGEWVPQSMVELDLALAGEAGFSVDPVTEARRLAAFDVLRVRADNPGPLTLSGTNTWVVDRDPAYVVDPGPALRQHLERVLAAVDARGGLGGIALTHDHSDHVESVTALRELRRAPVAAAQGEGVDVTLREGVRFGPLTAVPTPGHSPDHYAFVADRVCFTGDAVLGEGSAFVAPYEGALNAHLNGLVHLCTLELDVLCPGHGPAVWEPVAKLQECIGHRYDREHRLLAALAEGARTVTELLDKAWWDVPAELRPAATLTLAAHLDKLEEEGSLPAGVERPYWDDAVWEGVSWGELPGEDSGL